jgi:hypothetical protein
MGLLPGRKLELAAELRKFFVDSEARSDRSHLEEHAAGLPKVNRLEVLPVQHLRHTITQVEELASKP